MTVGMLNRKSDLHFFGHVMSAGALELSFVVIGPLVKRIQNANDDFPRIMGLSSLKLMFTQYLGENTTISKSS